MDAGILSNHPRRGHRLSARLTLVVAALIFAISLGIYALWNHETHSDTGVGILNMLSPSLMPTSRLVQNLASNDADLQRESLAVLAERKDPAGAAAALPLLKSKDAYVWLNAALYLGSLKRQEAVPYLIKGLRHYAWRAYPDCAADLTAITGKNFGTNAQQWRDWWEQAHQSSNFDFESNLGR